MRSVVQSLRERLDSLRFLVYAVVAALLVLLFVSAGATAAARVTVREAQHDLTTRLRPAESDVTRLAKAYVDQESGLRGYLLTGDAVMLEQYESGKVDAQRLVEDIRGLLATDPRALTLLNRVAVAAGTWQDRSAEPEIAARTSGRPASDPAVVDWVRSGQVRFDDLRSRLDTLATHVQALNTAQVRAITDAQSVANTVTGLSVVAAAVVALGAVLMLHRKLTRPLTRLVDDVQAVAGGDYEQPVDVTHPSEFALLAQSVEEMRDSILTEAARLAEAQEQLVLRDERDRVAAELHDLVIQRLFALGLLMSSQAARGPRVGAALEPLVEETDQIIRELRGVIFGIRRDPGSSTLRDRVCAAGAQRAARLGFQPVVHFTGPVDLAGAAAADAVVRLVAEGLDETGSRPGATAAAVEVTSTGRSLLVEVRDHDDAVVLSRSVELVDVERAG